MDSPRARKPGEAVFAALMLLLGMALFWQAYRISGFSALSSPGAFPLATSAAIVIAAAIVLAQTLTMRPPTRGITAFVHQIVPGVFGLVTGLIILFGIALGQLGFLISAFGFLTLGTWLLHKRGPWVALGSSLVSVILIYIVFRLVFQVVLPEGIVPERRLMAEFGTFISRMFGP